MNMSVKPNHISCKSIRLIEHGGLFIITVATLITGIQEILRMFAAGEVTLADLLLLFICLEVVAMVGVHLESDNTHADPHRYRRPDPLPGPGCQRQHRQLSWPLSC